MTRNAVIIILFCALLGGVYFFFADRFRQEQELACVLKAPENTVKSSAVYAIKDIAPGDVIEASLVEQIQEFQYKIPFGSASAASSVINRKAAIAISQGTIISLYDLQGGPEHLTPCFRAAKDIAAGEVVNAENVTCEVIPGSKLVSGGLWTPSRAALGARAINNFRKGHIIGVDELRH